MAVSLSLRNKMCHPLRRYKQRCRIPSFKNPRIKLKDFFFFFYRLENLCPPVQLSPARSFFSLSLSLARFCLCSRLPLSRSFSSLLLLLSLSVPFPPLCPCHSLPPPLLILSRFLATSFSPPSLSHYTHSISHTHTHSLSLSLD